MKWAYFGKIKTIKIVTCFPVLTRVGKISTKDRRGRGVSRLFLVTKDREFTVTFDVIPHAFDLCQNNIRVNHISLCCLSKVYEAKMALKIFSFLALSSSLIPMFLSG